MKNQNLVYQITDNPSCIDFILLKLLPRSEFEEKDP
jgi:hypothetical protein